MWTALKDLQHLQVFAIRIPADTRWAHPEDVPSARSHHVALMGDFIDWLPCTVEAVWISLVLGATSDAAAWLNFTSIDWCGMHQALSAIPSLRVVRLEINTRGEMSRLVQWKELWRSTIMNEFKSFSHYTGTHLSLVGIKLTFGLQSTNPLALSPCTLMMRTSLLIALSSGYLRSRSRRYYARVRETLLRS